MGETKREVAAVIGTIVVLMTIGVLLFSGSQVSTILSKVGASIPSGATSGGTSSQDQPAADGGTETANGGGTSTEQAGTANAAVLRPRS